MQQIKEKYDELYEMPVNSTIINDSYIIPGYSGRELNVDLTFFNMQKESTYDESKFIFNSLTPQISINDNKDKIIIRGNIKTNAVALIFESINPNTKYLKQNDYNINVLITKEEYDLYYELINSSNNETTYKNIESFLDKHRINKSICFLKSSKVPPLCQNKYLVQPSLTVTHSNIGTIKNQITSGEIIFVKDSVTATDLTLLLSEIKYRDLRVMPLSYLIKE